MSLFDLLQNLSQSFKNGFCLLLQEEPTDLFMQSSLVAQTYGNHWCEDQNKEHVWDESREFNELYGVDTSAFGDWNEDLQLCKALPREDFYQRANRDKTMVKIHNDFLRAAVEGAKAVIRGSIAPANPMDPKETQVFIYNQIFFSYAVDTPEHFKQDSGQDATFTFAAVNCDLRNLSLLHRMDLPNLFL
jgi:protein TIF31